MTTKRIPLCQTKGCPHPSDPDWHRCFVCKKEPIDHQHFPKKSLAGKGAEIVAALCRPHHQKITLHQWREGVYDHPDGSKRYYVQNQKGETMCDVVIEAAPREPDPDEGLELKPEIEERLRQSVLQPMTIDLAEAQRLYLNAGPDPTAIESVPDEQLAALFAEADKRQAEGFLLKCRIVHTFRERQVQAWGKSWIEEAYTLFHVSRRTLEVYARFHEILAESDNYLTEQIAPLTDSRSLVRHIGSKTLEDGKVALEAAVAHQAEFGEPPTVPALMHRLGEEKAETPPEPCPTRADGPHEWEQVCKWCRATKER